MCFEGMEESGSEGLDELILARKDDFFAVSCLLFLENSETSNIKYYHFNNLLSHNVTCLERLVNYMYL